MTTGSRLTAALAVALLLGCRGERWLIGEAPDAGAEIDAGLDAAVSVRCPGSVGEAIPLVRTPAALADTLLGSWFAALRGGEADAFPAARLQLQLLQDAATLRFESGSSVPQLLDPAAGYLCTSSVESCASPAGFVAGFDYTLVEARSRGSILSFGLFLDEPWDGWCRQQAPIEESQPGCEPRYVVEAAYDEARRGDSCAVRRAEEWTDIACDRLATVERQVCACTADGCRARARQQLVNLRQITPDQLEGALWFASDRAQGLLLSRDQ